MHLISSCIACLMNSPESACGTLPQTHVPAPPAQEPSRAAGADTGVQPTWCNEESGLLSKNWNRHPGCFCVAIMQCSDKLLGPNPIHSVWRRGTVPFRKAVTIRALFLVLLWTSMHGPLISFTKPQIIVKGFYQTYVRGTFGCHEDSIWQMFLSKQICTGRQCRSNYWCTPPQLVFQPFSPLAVTAEITYGLGAVFAVVPRLVLCKPLLLLVQGPRLQDHLLQLEGGVAVQAALLWGTGTPQTRVSHGAGSLLLSKRAQELLLSTALHLRVQTGPGWAREAARCSYSRSGQSPAPRASRPRRSRPRLTSRLTSECRRGRRSGARGSPSAAAMTKAFP